MPVESLHCRGSLGRQMPAGTLRRFSGPAIMMLTAWSLLGCYSYIPVNSSLPTTGSVRVILNDEGAASLRKTLGNDVRQIDGSVAGSKSDSLVIAVEKTFTSSGERFISSGDTVAISRASSERIDIRRISRKRSLLLGLGVIAVVILALAGINGSNGSASGDGQPSPIQP